MKVHDITLPVDHALANWPGDAPYQYESTCTIAGGSSVNLGAVSMSVHTGSHADAPYHFLPNGATIDAVPLVVYVGPAVVVDARGLDPIPSRVLDGIDVGATPRVLFRTDAWTDHTRFPQQIPQLAADLIQRLAREGACLVGLDVPSVDAIDSKELPNHRALGAAGIHILESLRLAGIPPGRYELIALPLRLAGADGSPVRAVLRELPTL